MRGAAHVRDHGRVDLDQVEAVLARGIDQELALVGAEFANVRSAGARRAVAELGKGQRAVIEVGRQADACLLYTSRCV